MIDIDGDFSLGNWKISFRFFGQFANDGTRLLVQLLFTVSSIVRGVCGQRSTFSLWISRSTNHPLNQLHTRTNPAQPISIYTSSSFSPGDCYFSWKEIGFIVQKMKILEVSSFQPFVNRSSTRSLFLIHGCQLETSQRLHISPWVRSALLDLPSC